MKLIFIIFLIVFPALANAQSYYGIHQLNLSKEIVYPFNKSDVILYQKQNVNFIIQTKPYSVTYHAWKPAELVDKVFKYKVTFKAKRNIGSGNYKLIISADVNDSAIYYQDKTFLINNTWSSFTDSALFPFNIDNNAKYKAFIYNENNSDTLYINDFKVEYFEQVPDDYLFQPLDYTKLKLSNAKVIYSNRYYKLNFLSLSNQLFFSSANNEIITGPIYSTVQTGNKSNFGNSHSPYFNLVNQINKGDSTLLEFTNENNEMQMQVMIICILNSPQVFINLKSTALKPKTIHRIALTVSYIDNLNRVMLPNAKFVTTPKLQTQYWLGKRGGLQIGSGAKQLGTVCNNKLSSLQVDNNRKILVFNLDYSLDHPMLNMPLLVKEENKKEDVSSTKIFKDDFIESSFSFIIGKDIIELPLINPHYANYKSTIIFTEHADWAIAETHRAVYFGSSLITNADNATGGFVKHNIPVTKSVFYHNPFNSNLKEVTSEVLLQKPFASLKENKEFELFVKELYKLNYEICLHSPEDKTTQKKWAEEALNYGNTEFKSKSWIDHGYDNAKESNREDFSCDGANVNSPLYLGALWKKNGIEYFWNPYYEDYPIGTKYMYNSSLLIPYNGMSTSLPNVNYSAHPNYPNFYQWYTYNLSQAPEPNLWLYFFNSQRLTDFINQSGTFISHVYPASIHNNYGFWKLNSSGEIVIEPAFDALLGKLNDLKKQEKINITTVQSWMEDNLNKEKLVYFFNNDKSYILNKSNKTISNIGLIYPDGTIKNVNFAPGEFKELKN